MTHSLNVFPRSAIAIPASVTMDAFSSQSATTVIGTAQAYADIPADGVVTDWIQDVAPYFRDR